MPFVYKGSSISSHAAHPVAFADVIASAAIEKEHADADNSPVYPENPKP
jgi:hypothetical protein